MPESGGESTTMITISRLEIVLLVLLVVLGMGTWVWVDRTVTMLLKPEEPREDQFQDQLNVRQMETDLLLNQEEQKATQTQVIQARLDLTNQTATVNTLKQFYPQLAQISTLSITATSTLSTTIPKEYIEQYAKARIGQ